MSQEVDVIDLQVGILELFGEAQQQSSYCYAYHERDSFTVRRGSGASAYRCEMCGSGGLTHRCVIPDKVPPKDFVCIPYIPDRMVSAEELDRRRASRARRCQSRTRLPEPFRGGRACPLCGATAPQHRCIGEATREMSEK